MVHVQFNCLITHSRINNSYHHQNWSGWGTSHWFTYKVHVLRKCKLFCNRGRCFRVLFKCPNTNQRFAVYSNISTHTPWVHGVHTCPQEYIDSYKCGCDGAMMQHFWLWWEMLNRPTCMHNKAHTHTRNSWYMYI